MSGFLIHSALEFHAQNTPDHAALSYQCQAMSYSTLNARANQLAHALMQQGARPQDRVGIYLFKGFELAIGMYGALKAGCIFVPLDPFMPSQRLAFIIKDCGIKHIVSDDALAEPLSNSKADSQADSRACSQPDSGSVAVAGSPSGPSPNSLAGLAADYPLHVYGVERELGFSQLRWSDIQQGSISNPDLIMIDQDLGYIMYTSGSTGEPKGMMHSHHGSITYARWGADHVRLTAADRVASHAPLHFDLSIFDFFSTVQAGATVVLVPEAVTRFPASWTQCIEDERISVVFTVPYTLISMYEQGAMDKRDLNSLRWIMFGGEPYPTRQLRQLMQVLDRVQFTNVYGPAEAPSCTCHDVTLDDVKGDNPLPIGIVSRNSADLIIDEQEEDCASGVAGELCIRSSTLTRGYWNRPDLNARAYLFRDGQGPFPTVYFRTGDRVVRHEDGLLRFLGRVDRMIKTRGQRVELDEVEAALASHDGVLEAAAFVVPAEHGSQDIMAAITRDDDSVIDGMDVLRHVRRRLPTYAVPRQITVHDSLPHTSSGKIDRRQLADQWKSSNQHLTQSQDDDQH